MEPYIVLVEDDQQDAMWISEALCASITAHVEVISCEKDFVVRLPGFAQARPDLVIFDMMLRWARAGEELELELEQGRVPTEVIEDGFLRAGLRCAERLRMGRDTKDIPYLIYTGLASNNFSEQMIRVADIITKSDDIRPLITAVRYKLK